MVFGIIFSFFAFILNIAAIYVNYSNGNYSWAVVNGVCSGATFTNTVWLIKEMIEE
jgi:hypothetical protein